MQNQLFKRDIVDQITPFLGTDNIIVLHGARQVGKTHILYYLENELHTRGELTHYIDLEDSRYLDILDAGVEPFLDYLKKAGFDLNSSHKLTVLIDEIQYLSQPSPFLKLVADHHKYLQLIVSGSSSFNIKSKFSDSLVGRTVNFEIYPLTFVEFLRFKQPPSLTPIMTSYQEFISFGGYPKIVLSDSILLKEKYLQQIIDTYVKKDIADLAGVKDIKKFNNLLKILASQSGQLLNIEQLANTCDLAVPTVRDYLSILEATYIIHLVTPFSTSAKVEVVKTPKIFFYDTGLLQMLWLQKLQTQNVGNIFETSVFSELVKKYGVDKINFWRNKNQNEIDFILNTRSRIIPIEVKSNFHQFVYPKISPFLAKYKLTDFFVVGLTGTKQSKHYIYPWEISTLN